jgi:phage baseplate assembly protein V
MTNQTGVISEVRYVRIGRGKMCEVRVKLDSVGEKPRDTNWLPKSGLVGGAFKMHVPPRVGDQVIVHNENGKHEDGYVTDNIAYVKQPLPKSINDDTAVMWLKDGTHLTFNLKKKEIEIKTPSKIFVNAPKVSVKAKEVVINALEVSIKALKTTITSNTKIIGFLEVLGLKMTHNGVNVGSTHTHGYDGEPT